MAMSLFSLALAETHVQTGSQVYTQVTMLFSLVLVRTIGHVYFQRPTCGEVMSAVPYMSRFIVSFAVFLYLFKTIRCPYTPLFTPVSFLKICIIHWLKRNNKVTNTRRGAFFKVILFFVQTQKLSMVFIFLWQMMTEI